MNEKVKPFLKCLDDKHKQVDNIKNMLPMGDRLIEPFVGTASVFLNTNYPCYLLADINADLINLYKALAAYQDEFIDVCRGYFGVIHNNLSSYNYYRDVFNNTSLVNVTTARRTKRAALFVYLNRHGFNGMTRYNAAGEFNVPYGYYEKPYFPEIEMQSFITKVNSADLVEFRVSDFRETLTKANENDVIYCDPPFVPLSATVNFTKYYGKEFTWHDQMELFTICKQLRAGKNIPSIISNHYTKQSKPLYEGELFEMVKSSVTRSVAGRRKKVSELLARV